MDPGAIAVRRAEKEDKGEEGGGGVGVHQSTRRGMRKKGEGMEGERKRGS